jgi:hypothetical protein
MFADVMKYDFGLAQWHLVIDNCIRVFNYIQVQHSQACKHTSLAHTQTPSYAQLHAYDHLFMHYPYVITRTMKKAIFYGYQPLLLLKQTLDRYIHAYTHMYALGDDECARWNMFQESDAKGFLAALYAAQAAVNELFGT